MDTEKIFEEITKLINAITGLGQPSCADYIQILSSIISIIISTIAVVMAVRIPKKIAEKQDKISLFNKRFEVYDVFCRYSAFAQEIENMSDVEMYKMNFVNMVCFGEIDEFQGNIALSKLIQVSMPLQHAAFLFENITDKELSELYSSICQFVVDMSKNDNVEESKERFVVNATTFWSNHIDDMRRMLKIV